MPKEAKARIKINKLLEDAGWRFFDDENGYANIQVEHNVKITKSKINALGENFEKIKNGFVDFLLLDEKGNPFIVLEAKSEDKDPLVGKEQAREYAKSLFVKYIILSNGNMHYFWDIYKGNPQIILFFPSYKSIKESKAMNANPAKLYNEEITSDYIAVVKDSNYMNAPEYKNIKTRKQFICDNNLNFLRGYQVNALKALQNSVKAGNQRFLFEMATGTGKTLTAAAVIKLFLRSGNANKVLFLVDRIELEEQAEKNFINYLVPDYRTLIFKKNIDKWRSADIVVSTVQTLMYNNKYKKYFKPTDFSLIIVDESHRSINGNNRAVFEYFLGYKLGLTATPKDYIKNIDATKLKSNDPRAWEKRQLLDSYRTFGCESGEPTYRYSLLEGVNDPEGPFLINPKVFDVRTDITTKLLAEGGYVVFKQGNEVKEDEKDEEGEIYFERDFEKKFFSEETNKIFVKTFIDNAKLDPISGEVGKGIVFCVSRRHASKITQLLNVYASKKFPDKYQSDFALQITSDVMNAQSYTTNFQNNNLSGHTLFLEAYKSSKTRICVTVGMMTTGYDCEDLLNIGLMRPIFSPTDFIQIKGRGTRMHDFVYEDKFNYISNVYKYSKDDFYLFDFFGNYEYFEEKFKYDVELSLPKTKWQSSDINTSTVEADGYENFEPDLIKSVQETKIGARGMKIDRMFFDKFEETVKDDPVARRQYEQGNYQAVIAYINENIMNKPTEFYSWDKLRKAIEIDRKITKKEILDKIFGMISFFKSKKEVVDCEFEKFILTQKISQEKYWDVKYFFEAYLTDKDVRRAIKDKKFSSLGTDIATYTLDELKELGRDNMSKVVEYINDNTNDFQLM